MVYMTEPTAYGYANSHLQYGGGLMELARGVRALSRPSVQACARQCCLLARLGRCHRDRMAW